MKLISKIAIGVVGLVIVLGGVYHMVNRAPDDTLTPNEQALAIIDDGQCLMCHSEGAKLPFYATMPIAKDLISTDINTGMKFIDLSEGIENLRQGKPVNEATLAKIERTVRDGSMPLARFSIMHWGSAISGKKVDMMQSWVSAHRLEHYSTGMASAEFATEAVQPLVDSIPVNPDKVALGDKLFHDTRFSADNTISCASCHGLNTGGVDNKQYSDGVGGQKGGVNAPTVYNAVFNFVQFWDGRAATLAAQAAGPPLNPVEMACESWDQIIEKLTADKELTAQFTAVYPEGYSDESLTDAIAEFEKTLITPNSPFGRYLKGDKQAITAQEIHGYELFNENKCATCHVGTNFGGQSYELIGLKGDYFADRGLELTEEDNGRYKETKAERDRHRFKTPTLRNVALTAPYMHDGTAQTLEQAIDMMTRYQLGITLPEADRADMVSFLKTLTGEYKGKTLTNS